MAIPKLFLTLDTLDQNEWSSCKKYMKMHFGEGTDNHVCLMALYRNRSTLSDEDLVLDIRQQFFPNMSQKSFFNMLSRLMGYVDDWIAYYTFQQERYLNDLYKIKAYSRKGLYKIANQKAKLLEDEIFSVEGLNLDKSKALGDLYRVQYYSDNPIKHERLDLFRLMVEQKTIKLCNDLMLYHAEMSNWGRIKKLDFEDLKTMTMAVAEVAPASEELKTLKTLVKMVEHFDIESFHYLREKLVGGVFDSRDELRILIGLYVITFSGSFWIKGHLKDLNVFVELHDYGLQERLLFPDGKIILSRFINLVIVYSVVAGYEITQEFIEKWIPSVLSKGKNFAKAYSSAFNALHSKNYDKILLHLRTVTTSNVSRKIAIARLELIAFFMEEKRNYQFVLDNIKRFLRLVKRNKKSLSLDSYTRNQIFGQEIKKLLVAQRSRTQYVLPEAKNLFQRRWFLDVLKMEKQSL